LICAALLCASFASELPGAGESQKKISIHTKPGRPRIKEGDRAGYFFLIVLLFGRCAELRNTE
jgi:hypothetical protein